MFYAVGSLAHRMNLSVDLDADPDIGVTFPNIIALRRNGSTAQLSVMTAGLLAVLEPLFAAGSATFDRFELWKYTPLSFDASYVSSDDISDVGSSGSSSVLAGEQIFTFRTQEGGIMRVQLEESTEEPGGSQNYGELSALNKAVVDHFLDSDNIWLARDTSYPIAFIGMHPGQNERNFKRRYRGL